jgi:hypothetical protein
VPFRNLVQTCLGTFIATDHRNEENRTLRALVRYFNHIPGNKLSPTDKKASLGKMAEVLDFWLEQHLINN